MVGTGSHNRLQGAPEPSRDLFVYRTRENTVEADLVAFFKDKEIEPSVVERVVSSKHTLKFPCFRVKLALSDAKIARQSTFWPRGVYVRKYFNPHFNPAAGSKECGKDSAAKNPEDDETTSLKQYSSDG